MQTDPTPPLTQHQADALEFYNMLMWDIEPELTTDMLPELELLYADEKEEDRAERMQWYEEAFEVFKQRAKEVKAQSKETLQKVLKNIAKLSRQHESGAEQEKLASIEDSLAES